IGKASWRGKGEVSGGGPALKKKKEASRRMGLTVQTTSKSGRLSRDGFCGSKPGTRWKKGRASVAVDDRCRAGERPDARGTVRVVRQGDDWPRARGWVTSVIS